MSKIENINKLFIISAGRTGTDFFGKNFSFFSKHIYSIHQPDVINLEKSRRKELFFKLKHLGFYNLIIAKLIGKSGTRNLSLIKVRKKNNENKIIQKLLKERTNLNLNYSKLYIESNWQLFGLIEDLLKFNKSKILIVFRDPRDWVSSWMNKGGWYDKNDLLSKINILGFKRVTPANVGIDNPDWKDYSRFQKLCWVWNYMNGNFYEAVKENNPNIRHFFFEDIFAKRDESTIKDFLQFSLGEYFKDEYVDQMLSMLQHKVNQKPKEEFPNWIEWDKKHCQYLHYFCGDLMKELGYGTEPEWLKKIE